MILIFTLFALSVSFYENRFFLLRLTADKFKIKINYCFKLKKYEFLSDWNNIEIKQSSSFQRNPSIILILKYRGKVIIKLYSDVNKDLTDEKMILLIEMLKGLKIQATNSKPIEYHFQNT